MREVFEVCQECGAPTEGKKWCSKRCCNRQWMRTWHRCNREESNRRSAAQRSRPDYYKRHNAYCRRWVRTHAESRALSLENHKRKARQAQQALREQRQCAKCGGAIVRKHAKKYCSAACATAVARAIDRREYARAWMKQWRKAHPIEARERDRARYLGAETYHAKEMRRAASRRSKAKQRSIALVGHIDPVIVQCQLAMTQCRRLIKEQEG